VASTAEKAFRGYHPSIISGTPRAAIGEAAHSFAVAGRGYLTAFRDIERGKPAYEFPVAVPLQIKLFGHQRGHDLSGRTALHHCVIISRLCDEAHEN
jgi:hypothetical protein